MKWPANVIGMIADVLAPNRYQAVSNHCAAPHLTWVSHCIMQQMPHVTAIQPKKCLRDWQHVGFFVIDRYSNKALWPVMGSHGVSFLSLGTYFADVFSCDQAALWMVFSVRLSVCLSVCPSVTSFWLCSHHRIIMKFSGVITMDQGKVHAKGQGQRSKVKVTEVTTQLDRFRTVTPVWIHIWWWNFTYSLMLLRRGALLFFKVIRQISRSHGAKNRRIWPRLGVSGL